jgi:hypothetical protein
VHHAWQNKQTAGLLFGTCICRFRAERRSPRGAHFGYTFLEWAYEDENVRVRDGADSYLIGNGKIVAQTIHYTVEQK